MAGTILSIEGADDYWSYSQHRSLFIRGLLARHRAQALQRMTVGSIKGGGLLAYLSTTLLYRGAMWSGGSV